MRVIALTTLLLSLTLPLPTGTSNADNLVITGNPEADDCYRATMLPDSFAASAIGSCNTALNARRISKRDRASILINRGILFNHAANYPAAIEDFEAALALIPNFPEAYINRGNTYFYAGNIEKAIADYNRAIKRESPRQHTAYFNRGLANETKKQPDLAFADFVRAKELKPDWVLATARVERYLEHGYKTSD